MIRTIPFTIIMVVTCFSSLSNFAQDIMPLLPQPRHVERLEGVFSLTADTKIVVSDAVDADLQNTIELIQRRVAEITKPPCELTTAMGKTRTPYILPGIIGQNEQISEALTVMPLKEQPQTEEGYVLEITPTRVLLAGKTGAGLFYAAQTFLQLIYTKEKEGMSVPCVRIVDWPESAFRGVMIDSSQGTLPNVATVKRFIRTFGELKINRYYLYSEDTLEYPDQPLVGEPGGRYTPDDVRDIVAEGLKNYVEIVPCVQFHGHLHNVLRMEKYSNLAEIPHGGELSPGREGVDEFIENCVKYLAETFPSPYIHVGGDETYELGTGRSRERFPDRPAGEIYLEHAHRIHEIIRKYGRIPEVWGDIILNHPEIIDKIAKDTRMMSWSYFERKDDFGPLVEPFAKADLPFVVCPGVRNWMQIYPNFKGMRTVIDQFMKKGREFDAAGILNTLWIDTCEELHSLNYYGFAYGAAAGWQSGTPDLQNFEKAFAWSFHRDETGEILNAYHEMLESQLIAESLYSGSSIRLHWLDPFVEANQKRIVEWEPKLREMRLHAENALEQLYRAKQQSLRNQDLLDFIEYAALRLDLAGLKLLYGPEMSRIYRAARNSNDSKQIWLAAIQLGASTKANKCRIYDLIFMTGNLKALYKDLWLRGNTPYNLEGTLALWDKEIQKYWDMHAAINQAWDESRRTKTLPPPEPLGFFVD